MPAGHGKSYRWIEEDRDLRYQHASEIEWSTRQSSSTAIGTAWPVTIWSSIAPRCRIRQRLSFFKTFFDTA